jgi:hypothetical protein
MLDGEGKGVSFAALGGYDMSGMLCVFQTLFFTDFLRGRFGTFLELEMEKKRFSKS